MSDIPIDAPLGTRVVYANPESGFDPQIALGKAHLSIGAEYTIERTEIHSWHTDVFLRERPGVGFNSTLFDLAESDPPATTPAREEQDLAGIKERAEKAIRWHTNDEAFMEIWDAIRRAVKESDGSHPRDLFESLIGELDAEYADHIKALLTALTAATLRATKAEEAERGLREALTYIAENDPAFLKAPIPGAKGYPGHLAHVARAALQERTS